MRSSVLKIWITALSLLLSLELLARLQPLEEPASPHEILVSYQKSKVQKIPPGALVLVGDSSLGNGVDARILSEKLEIPVFNLALTGSDSFYGARLILESLYAQGKKPSMVVAVVAVQTLAQEISEGTLDDFATGETSLPTENTYQRFCKWPFELSALVQQSRTYRRVYLSAGRGLRLKPLVGDGLRLEFESELSQLDYLPQGPHKNWTHSRPIQLLNVHPTQSRALTSLAELCRSKGTPLRFQLGPAIEVSVSSPSFQRELDDWMSKNAPRLLSRDLQTFPPEAFGDQNNHLKASGKSKLTDLYRDLLEELIQELKGLETSTKALRESR